MRTLAGQNLGQHKAQSFAAHGFGFNTKSLQSRPLSFQDSDHGVGDGNSLAWLDRILQEAGLPTDGEVWLHCFPRMWGFAFKPVSFWHIHSTDGLLRAVLAEVNNTFGERHAYLLHNSDKSEITNGALLQAQKVFHVSPFYAVRGRYDFRFVLLPHRSVVRLDYFEPEKIEPEDTGHKNSEREHIEDKSTAHNSSPSLSTSLSGVYVPLSPLSVARTLFALPWQALFVVLRININAFHLWRKGAQWHSKPPPPVYSISAPRIDSKPNSKVKAI